MEPLHFKSDREAHFETNPDTIGFGMPDNRADSATGKVYAQTLKRWL
jgi:hypothetical protein